MMCVMTMARAAGVHSIDSYAVLGEYCEESTMAVRVVGCFPTTNDLYGDHCRHWWWLEPIVCTHLAVGASCRCLFSGRGWSLTHSVVTARARTKDQGQLQGQWHLCVLAMQVYSYGHRLYGNAHSSGGQRQELCQGVQISQREGLQVRSAVQASDKRGALYVPTRSRGASGCWPGLVQLQNLATSAWQ